MLNALLMLLAMMTFGKIIGKVTFSIAGLHLNYNDQTI